MHHATCGSPVIGPWITAVLSMSMTAWSSFVLFSRHPLSILTGKRCPSLGRGHIQELGFSVPREALLLYGILDSLFHLSNLAPSCGRRGRNTFMNLSRVGGLKFWPPGGIYLWAAALSNSPSWDTQSQQAEAAPNRPSHAGDDVSTAQHFAGCAPLCPQLPQNDTCEYSTNTTHNSLRVLEALDAKQNGLTWAASLFNFSRNHKNTPAEQNCRTETLHPRDLPSLHSIPGCWNETFNPKNAG